MYNKIRLLVKERAYQFLGDEEALSATEYAIMLGLVVVGSLVVIRQIGEDFSAIFTYIDDSLPETAD